MNFYRQFGFADARCQLKDASRKAYAVPSLNFITMEQLNAIADALLARRSPVILMVAPKHCRQFETQMIVRMAQGPWWSGCGLPAAAAPSLCIWITGPALKSARTPLTMVSLR